jgi:hypothetical protein
MWGYHFVHRLGFHMPVFTAQQLLPQDNVFMYYKHDKIQWSLFLKEFHLFHAQKMLYRIYQYLFSCFPSYEYVLARYPLMRLHIPPEVHIFAVHNRLCQWLINYTSVVWSVWCTLWSSRWLCFLLSPRLNSNIPTDIKIDKKSWEELITYVSLKLHGPYKMTCPPILQLLRLTVRQSVMGLRARY